MMYWYGGHMSGWGYALGITGMVLFWGLLIAAVVAGVRWLGRARQSGFGPQSPTAEQVLAERFARGEIDADEYRARLHTLRQGTHPPPPGAGGGPADGPRAE